MATRSNTAKDLLELITLDEAARLRGVTRPAISYLVSQGRIRSQKLFGRILVYRGEVLNYKPSKGGRPKGKSKKAERGGK
jgi:excisionase family DNA binding protein